MLACTAAAACLFLLLIRSFFTLKEIDCVVLVTEVDGPTNLQTNNDRNITKSWYLSIHLPEIEGIVNDNQLE